MVKVSLLIPAYNEAETIVETVKRARAALEGFLSSFEILVIDDGSTDDTGRHAAEAGATVLRHDSNRGYGAALKTGLRHAQGEIVVITDADLTYPAERIPELVNELAEADMAVGARTGASVHIPLFRRPAKWILNRLANRVAGRRIPDLNSGLRAFKRDLALRYLHLYPEGFSFTTTLTLAALCDGCEVRYLPIDYARRAGKSKIHPLRDTFNFLVLIVRVAAYFEPLRVFLPATFVSAGISALLLTYYFITDGGVSDAGVLACLFTLLIFMMGILADLVVRRARS
ncbi:MAG: glycosyltransferase family 2 protein [Candidatus Omnitrophica bacterium]|nr:Undecaprenyl-phosphate 4-deoxy-4-formamido-L-arabinose transferase [bacterium]NUN96727.1 glycosyltransferase family 2 protein [Candidatus Omnitrophota bacterium]